MHSLNGSAFTSAFSYLRTLRLWATLCVFLFGISALGASKRKVTISWQELGGVKYYEFQLSRSPIMDPLLLRKKYRKNEVVLKLSPGAYYFRVRGIDSRKRPGEWTEVQGFSVNATIPKAKEPEHKKIFRKPLPDGKVEFNWSEGPEGTTYLIEISTKRGELVKRELYDTSFVWHPPKSGIYYWRVGHQTSSGEEWGKKRVFGVKRSALGAVVSAPVEEKEEKSEDKPEKKKRRRKLASRSELWFSLHVGQSLLFYNSEDLDVNVDASADAFVGLAGARLEYWTERMRGQTYRWRFLAEGEGLRQTLSNETFILPRFRAAGFYLLKSKRLYYGPGVKLGYATGRIFIVNTSNIIQKNVSVNRYRPGLGGFILNRVSREWAMGANAWVRYDLGGESTETGSLEGTLGFEGAVKAYHYFSKSVRAHGRLRGFQEVYKWNRGEVSNLYVVLDGGIHFRF